MIHPWTKQFFETKTIEPKKTDKDILKPPKHGRETIKKREKRT